MNEFIMFDEYVNTTNEYFLNEATVDIDDYYAEFKSVVETCKDDAELIEEEVGDFLFRIEQHLIYHGVVESTANIIADNLGEYVLTFIEEDGDLPASLEDIMEDCTKFVNEGGISYDVIASNVYREVKNKKDWEILAKKKIELYTKDKSIVSDIMNMLHGKDYFDDGTIEFDEDDE
jgi:hypothetical protein